MGQHLGDQAFAGRFRDIVTRITKKVVADERPEPRIGKVYSIDTNTQTAMILFAGDTVDNLVRARYAKNMKPNVVMSTAFSSLGYEAPSDIVRVWGKPGSYFILDYYSGGPSIYVEPEKPLLGVPMAWMTSSPPAKHIILDGVDRSRTEYPDLFALWGTTYGAGDGSTTFGIPNGTDRMLIGKSGTIPLGSTGGSKTKTIVAANLPPHSHTTPAHTHPNINVGGNVLEWGSGGTAGVQAGATAGVRASGSQSIVVGSGGASSTGNGPGTSSALDVMNPYLGVNWIVRAAY